MKIKSIIWMVILMAILLPFSANAEFVVKQFSCKFVDEKKNGEWMCYYSAEELTSFVNDFIKEVESEHKVKNVSYEPINIFNGSTGAFIITIEYENENHNQGKNTKSWLWRFNED